jgi:hypothetical protein
MRSGTWLWLATTMAATGLGLGSSAASAWEGGWGRYSPAYYGPPVRTTSPPAVVYPGPPVYAYSYLSPGGGTSYSGYYTARINVFRGPRWNYSAAYYTSPTVHRAAYGRHGRRGGAARFCPRYPAYIRGPIVPASRPR